MASIEVQASEKKCLNPEALEFRPSSVAKAVNPVIFPSPAGHAAAVFHHLPAAVAPPLPVPPPPFGYFPQPQQVMVYYHHLHHYVTSVPLPKTSPSNGFYLRKADLKLPRADDCLGLITSPTSTTSPPEPIQCYRKPFLKTSTRKNHGPSKRGRIHRRFATASGKWVKKSENPDPTPTPADAPVPLAAYPFGDCTSLMIRNIPVRLSRRELMVLLDDHCREENDRLSKNDEPYSQFDLLYLPIDFKKKGNLGYAFVNFTTWQGASRLYNSWRGCDWINTYNTKKICQIDPAKYQGEELKKRLGKSVYYCESDEFLPVEISPPRDGNNAKVTKLNILGTHVERQLATLS